MKFLIGLISFSSITSVGLSSSVVSCSAPINTAKDLSNYNVVNLVGANTDYPDVLSILNAFAHWNYVNLNELEGKIYSDSEGKYEVPPSYISTAEESINKLYIQITSDQNALTVTGKTNYIQVLFNQKRGIDDVDLSIASSLEKQTSIDDLKAMFKRKIFIAMQYNIPSIQDEGSDYSIDYNTDAALANEKGDYKVSIIPGTAGKLMGGSLLLNVKII